MPEDAWIRAAIDVEEAAALTARLVAIRSYPGEEGAVQRAIAAWLAENGMEPEMQTTEGDRPNVLAWVRNGDGPTFLLNGHVDTVLAVEGWSRDPWQGWRDGDRLYGLGACDMKSGVVAAMLATRALARHRDQWRGTVLFTSVVDEEAYSIGARALVERGIRADGCVVTESSDLEVVIGCIGKVLVRGEVTGKAAHASWPERGINAAVEAAKFVARLDDVPLGQHPRLTASQCVLSFESGNAQYVITVPEYARFTINRHTIPGESDESVLAGMRALAASLDSPATFAFSIDPPYYPPWEMAPDHPFVRTVQRACVAETGGAPITRYNRGLADANYFAADLGIPTVMFGATGANYHEADEWVNIPSIGICARMLIRIALSVLQSGD
ncbi:MAG: M20 family metallopeptidase [Chloroflexota bacterium]|nr:M20 family metallopeptidase [Chloroflexota bacterium]